MSRDSKLALSIDLGGTFIKAGLVNSRGEIFYFLQKETQINLGKKEVINNLKRIIKELINKTDKKKIIGISLGVPGPIDFKKGVIKNPPNFPDWRNIQLRSIIENEFSIPTILEHDANSALLGELWQGKARNKKNVVLLTLGTGVGGAILINGQIYRGQSGAAGELGHMIIDRQSKIKCGCGNYGCLESLVSVTGIKKELIKQIKEGRKSLVRKLVNDNWLKINGLIIYQAALMGDNLSKNILITAGGYLGLGIINLINIFNPEIIIITGQLSRACKFFLESMRETVRKKSFLIKPPSITVSSFINKGGILGGGYLQFIN